MSVEMVVRIIPSICLLFFLFCVSFSSLLVFVSAAACIPPLLLLSLGGGG